MAGAVREGDRAGVGDRDGQLNSGGAQHVCNKSGGVEASSKKDFRYEVVFDNIVSQEDEYTVTISTELNGRTVTQMVEKFPMSSQEETD